jgi:hypothetical protein
MNSSILNRKSRKYENSKLKKFTRPVAFAAWFPTHRARVSVLVVFANSASS